MNKNKKVYEKKAIEVLKKINEKESTLLVDGIKNGKIYYSQPTLISKNLHIGVLWDLKPKHKEIIKELESRGSFVYHVIEGNYLMPGGENVLMESYLLLSKEDIEDDDMSLETVFELKDKAFAVYSFVVNRDWEIKEYGSIGVKIQGGGMIRTV